MFVQKIVWALVKRIVVGHRGSVEILVGMLLLVPELSHFVSQSI